MKFCKSVLLALCAAPVALAFTPSNLGHHTNHVASCFSTSPRVSRTAVPMSMAAKEVDTSDVSIPYDAAARLAYDEWRAKYDKGNFDNSRYPIFKANYEAITVANVVSKAQARQEGSEAPSLLTLNEFGDFTEEEYSKAMEKSAATTTGDVLGKAMDAAQSQEEASSALKDAADALAEEEEALAKKLGLESVEELEAALDSMEGIAEDGGELESDNIAREARVRSAYLSWCKDNGKEPDENRFRAFSSNFLTMEKYSQETGKEMVLNKYADFTEQEYAAMQSSQKPAAEKRAVIPKATVVAEKSPEEIEAEREAERKAFEEAQAKRQQEIVAAEKKRAAYAEEMAQFQKKREEQAKKDAEKRAELLKQQAEARKQAEEEEKERRASIEKERAERQRNQELEKAKMEAATAAAAIAAAKSSAQKEAAQVAERRAMDEKAFEIARQEAKAWEARQKKIAIKPSTPPPITKPKPKPKPMPVASAPKPGISFFASPSQAAQKPKAPKAPPPKSAAVSFFSSPAPAPKKAAPAFSFFNQPAAAPKPKKDVAREAERARLERERIQQEANKKREQDLQATKAAAEKVKVEREQRAKEVAEKQRKEAEARAAEAEQKRIQAQKEQEARKKAAAAKSTPAPAPKPAAPTPVAKVAPPVFNFFGSPAPKAAIPKPKPATSAPAPAAKKAPAPSFSFFGSPAPAPEPVKLPAIQAPPKPMATPFSFLGGSPKQATKKTPKPEAPTGEVPSRPGTMSLFTAEKKAAASKPKQTQVPQRSGTLSLFGEKAAKKPEPKIPNRSGTLSIFGNATPPPKPAPKAEAAAPSRPTFSLFGGLSSGASAAPKVDPSLPVLTRWKQNPNGSITGIISNSKNFRTGTEITTSPVGRGAQKGSVVKTGSGSQYVLK